MLLVITLSLSYRKRGRAYIPKKLADFLLNVARLASKPWGGFNVRKVNTQLRYAFHKNRIPDSSDDNEAAQEGEEEDEEDSSDDEDMMEADDDNVAEEVGAGEVGAGEVGAAEVDAGQQDD